MEHGMMSFICCCENVNLQYHKAQMISMQVTKMVSEIFENI